MKALIHLIFIGIATLFFSLNSAAQGTSDSELASYYLSKGEYEKALLYFEKLYGPNPSVVYYNGLIKCYSALGNIKEAEKTIKRQYKISRNDPVYLVDLGVLYLNNNRTNEAEKVFGEISSELGSNVSYYLKVSRKYKEYNLPELALETLLKGKKSVDNSTIFSFDIADLYGELKQIDKLVEEYFFILESSPNYIQAIQNRLGRVFDFSEPSDQNDRFKEQLIQKVQQNPNDLIFADLLIWVYIQEQNFQGAYIQARAIDKRFNERGKRLLELGNLAANNNHISTALKCFEYVMQLDERGPYYPSASKRYVQTLYKKVTAYDYNEAELNNLINLYNNSISKLKGHPISFEYYIELARLMAYYKHNTDSAVAVLQQATQLPGLTTIEKATANILLGDIYVIQGEVWEASLLFGKVENEFKYDEIGQEAKFKNAEVFYFTGNFNWARAQVNVLKGSTSKLIANDAIRLSLLITDNTGWDSTETALQLFAEAELFVRQNKLDSALLTLQNLKQQEPTHGIQDEILYLEYSIHMRNKEFEAAEKDLQTIVNQYGYDILADDALFYLGQLYENQLKDKDKAMATYEKLLLEHTDSVFTTEARKRFRTLRGDFIN